MALALTPAAWRPWSIVLGIDLAFPCSPHATGAPNDACWMPSHRPRAGWSGLLTHSLTIACLCLAVRRAWFAVRSGQGRARRVAALAALLSADALLSLALGRVIDALSMLRALM